MTVGDRIRLRREYLGLTQEELAHKLGLSGKSSVAKVEARGDAITTKNVSKYAEALETTPSYLMGWDGLDDVYIEFMQNNAESNNSRLYANILAEYLSEQQLKKLNKCIERLNEQGIKKLLERAEELVEVEKYLKKDDAE